VQDEIGLASKVPDVSVKIEAKEVHFLKENELKIRDTGDYAFDNKRKARFHVQGDGALEPYSRSFFFSKVDWRYFCFVRTVGEQP
jgi:hypothetical protein